MNLMVKYLAAAVVALALIAGCATDSRQSAPDYQALVASADRMEGDRATDVRRKPEQLLAFYGVRQGMTVLDVGQGLAIVVRTHRHALLYDSGPMYAPDMDSGSRIVVPYLRATGVRRLDGMIVSHEDSDHAASARPYSSRHRTEPPTRRGAVRREPEPGGRFDQGLGAK